MLIKKKSNLVSIKFSRKLRQSEIPVISIPVVHISTTKHFTTS